MRSAVAVFDDAAYDDWSDLFPLQDGAVALVEDVLGAAIRGKAVVDHYGGAPSDGRLDLSARPIGGRPLLQAQFVDATVLAGGATLAALLDLTGDTPAMVLSDAVPPLDDVANPLRIEYRFVPQSPLPQAVADAVALAFRSAFDVRYRGGLPVPSAQIETMLAGEAAMLGPYD